MRDFGQIMEELFRDATPLGVVFDGHRTVFCTWADKRVRYALDRSIVLIDAMGLDSLETGINKGQQFVTNALEPGRFQLREALQCMAGRHRLPLKRKPGVARSISSDRGPTHEKHWMILSF